MTGGDVDCRHFQRVDISSFLIPYCKENDEGDAWIGTGFAPMAEALLTQGGLSDKNNRECKAQITENLL